MNFDKLLCFRIILLTWIILANLILQLLHIECSWIIFISNILLFTMNGDLYKNLLSVEIGGFVGLLCACITILSIEALQPIVGQICSIMIPLALVLSIIILCNPVAPILFNNCSFAYFTCALISPETFSENIWHFLGVYLVGSILVNGLCVYFANKLLNS